jgi:hypothetical protein
VRRPCAGAGVVAAARSVCEERPVLLVGCPVAWGGSVGDLGYRCRARCLGSKDAARGV